MANEYQYKKLKVFKKDIPANIYAKIKKPHNDKISCQKLKEQGASTAAKLVPINIYTKQKSTN